MLFLKKFINFIVNIYFIISFIIATTFTYLVIVKFLMYSYYAAYAEFSNSKNIYFFFISYLKNYFTLCLDNTIIYVNKIIDIRIIPINFLIAIHVKQFFKYYSLEDIAFLVLKIYINIIIYIIRIFSFLIFYNLIFYRFVDLQIFISYYKYFLTYLTKNVKFNFRCFDIITSWFCIPSWFFFIISFQYFFIFLTRSINKDFNKYIKFNYTVLLFDFIVWLYNFILYVFIIPMFKLYAIIIVYSIYLYRTMFFFSLIYFIITTILFFICFGLDIDNYIDTMFKLYNELIFINIFVDLGGFRTFFIIFFQFCFLFLCRLLIKGSKKYIKFPYDRDENDS